MGVADFSKELSSPVKFLGIEFAPKDVPFERRLQTFSALVWFVTVIGWPVSSFQLTVISISILAFFKCYGTITLLLGFIILYLSWIFYFDADTPKTGLRRSNFVRGWQLWKHFNNYFPIKLVKTAELDPTKNYLFCSHPHGLLCEGVFGGFATDGNKDLKKLFPEFKFSILTFDASFMFPISRDIALLLGIRSACRKSMNFILSQPRGGNIAVLMPGGAPEALDFCQDSNIIQLKKRKGFVKVAIQNGSPLVPVFSFGENRIYNQIHNEKGSVFRWLQDTVQKLIDIPPVIFYGRGIFQYTFGFLPKRQPTTVVVGAPIPVEKYANPTQSQIDDLHEKYVNSLTELFNSYKDKYSTNPNDTLVIT